MVMRCLVRRYVTNQQRKAEETGITEDDVNEVKQAVNSFRSTLFETLRNNGMKCEHSPNETRENHYTLYFRNCCKIY